MSSGQSAREILDREFLPTRAKILEIAATLDRNARAGGAANDPRLTQLHSAIEILLKNGDARAEEIQLLFSRAYDSQWWEALEMPDDAK